MGQNSVTTLDVQIQQCLGTLSTIRRSIADGQIELLSEMIREFNFFHQEISKCIYEESFELYLLQHNHLIAESLYLTQSLGLTETISVGKGKDKYTYFLARDGKMIELQFEDWAGCAFPVEKYLPLGKRLVPAHDPIKRDNIAV